MPDLKKLTVLLAMCCTCSICLAQQATDIIPGRARLSITEAAGLNSPYPALLNFNASLSGQGVGPDFTVPASRFPVIPLRNFISFYNRVVTSGHIRVLNTFFNTFSANIRNYAHNESVNCTDNSNAVAVIEASNLALAQSIAWVSNDPTISRTPAGINATAQYFTWLPGNLYIGPTNRSDLPGNNNLDIEARRIIGQAQWDRLNTLNTNMANYTSSGNAAFLPIIADELDYIARIIRSRGLTAGQWQFMNGQYRINPNSPVPADSEQQSAPDVPANAQACTNLEPTFERTKRRFRALTMSIDD